MKAILLTLFFLNTYSFSTINPLTKRGLNYQNRYGVASHNKPNNLRTDDTLNAPIITSSICTNELIKSWDKRFGGGGEDIIISMLPTSTGGYLLGGNSTSTLFGDKTQDTRGFRDYWVIKVDADGNKIWDKRFGGNNSDFFSTMTCSDDGGYLLGGYTNSGLSGDKTQPLKGSLDYWVVKIDADGNKLWDKSYGGSDYEDLDKIVPTGDGGYLLAGFSSSGISEDKTQDSQGSYDYWIVKIDANGNKIWDKSFGGNNSEFLTSLISNDDGSYLLGGVSYSGVSGDKTQSSQGDADYWIVKIDANGNKIWDKSFGGSEGDHMLTNFKTADGGYLLGGNSRSGNSGDKTQSSQGNRDYWVVKIDVNGNKLWDKRFGGNNDDFLLSIAAANDDGYILAGYSDSDISGDKTQIPQGEADYWVIKIDVNGNKVWDKRFGGNNNDNLTSMLTTENGEYILGGVSESGISGDKTQISQGGADYWIVKTTFCKPVNNLCVGQNYTLTATGCIGTVNWSNGAAGNSIIVSTAGTYIATCTVNGHTSPNSNTIVVLSPLVSLNGTAANGLERAAQTITSTQAIPSGVTMTYQAGNSISLQGAFQAQTGSIFKAEIKGCN